MRLSLFRLQRCRALVGRKRLLRFRLFDRLPQGKPGPVLTFGHVRGGFQLSRCPQKLLRLRLPGLGQLQPKIQVRFKNVRLSRYRFAVSRNRLVQPAQLIFYKAKIEPSHVARGLAIEQFPKQRFGGGVVPLFNRSFQPR